MSETLCDLCGEIVDDGVGWYDADADVFTCDNCRQAQLAVARGCAFDDPDEFDDWWDPTIDDGEADDDDDWDDDDWDWGDDDWRDE